MANAARCFDKGSKHELDDRSSHALGQPSEGPFSGSRED